MNDPGQPSGPSFEPAPNPGPPPGFAGHPEAPYASSAPGSPWRQDTAVPAQGGPWATPTPGSPWEAPGGAWNPSQAYPGAQPYPGATQPFPGATPAYSGMPQAYPMAGGAAYPTVLPGRPGTVTVAAVMGFVMSGWCLLLGAILMAVAGGANLLPDLYGLDAVVGVLMVAGLIGIAISVLLIVAGVKVLGGQQNWRLGFDVLLALPLMPNLIGLLASVGSPDADTASAIVVLLILVAVSVVGLVLVNLRVSTDWFKARTGARRMPAYPPGAPPTAWQ